jgi:hypothetical protein
MPGGNVPGIVELSGAVETRSVPGDGGAGCSCALEFRGDWPPIKTNITSAEPKISLREIVFFILTPWLLFAYNIGHYSFRPITVKSIQAKLHL